MASYSIPPLRSGGIMLTYHCNNACRHCLYRCKPSQSEQFITDDEIDATFAALSEDKFLMGVHLAGGEASLKPLKVITALRCAQKYGVSVDYLETNASWCDSIQNGKRLFAEFRDAGLEAVLISASLFHNEFIPLKNTENAIFAAQDIFGVGNVIVWTPNVLNLMRKHLDPDRTHTLKESCDKIGIKYEGTELWSLHSYLTPAGRAAETLSKGMPRKTADAYKGQSCRRELENTSHFHLTPEGHLFTGLCAGISIANRDDLHPAITNVSAPIFTTLCDHGPHSLIELAGENFTHQEEGYISKCHLCMEARKVLFETGKYTELGPAAYYR